MLHIWSTVRCDLCINRNIVECKASPLTLPEERFIVVLIETLWNVKNDFNVSISFCITVLIETLWNVKNAKFVVYNDGALGINRNIVECKVFQVLLLRLSWRSINRNIVECKVVNNKNLRPLLPVLIKPLWNVKWEDTKLKTSADTY